MPEIWHQIFRNKIRSTVIRTITNITADGQAPGFAMAPGGVDQVTVDEHKPEEGADGQVLVPMLINAGL